MNILVTGGAGFIGTHLVRAMEGRAVWLDKAILPPSAEGGTVRDCLEWCRRERRMDRNAFPSVHTIVHLAAATEVRATDDAHVADTLESVREAIAIADIIGAKRFIFSSSCAIHGDGTLPISVYGACKLGAEGLVNAWAHRTGNRASILRLSNVVGPGCRGVIPDTLRKLKANPHELPVLGDGSARKRFTHVSDVVRILLDPPDGIHDIAPEDETSIRDVVQWCVQMTKTDPHITWGESPQGWTGDMTATFGKAYPGLLTSEAAAKRGIYDCVSEIWSS